MKVFLSVLFICSFTFCKAQNNYPKLEAYAAPSFFLEHLSNDSLVPPERRSKTRLGDYGSYAIQFALPLKKKRFTIKAGAGFTTRHYSLNKYSLFPIFFFPGQDGFTIRRVKFTNYYFQVPVSGSYTVTRPLHNFQLAVGLTLRSDFLSKSNADITFDSTYKVPTASDINQAKTIYTQQATKYVATIEPYAEGSFLVYKNFGAFIQLRPFSFYASELDKRLTTSTVEIFSSTFGIFYRLK